MMDTFKIIPSDSATLTAALWWSEKEKKGETETRKLFFTFLVRLFVFPGKIRSR